MNKLTLAFFVSILFWTTTCYTQIYSIDSLPQQGILLDKGWKWHPGDNPDFAKADFDDSKWKSIDPTEDYSKIPDLKNYSIGWLRLKLDFNNNYHKTILGLMINQMVASEIYFNGKQIAKFGIISNDITKIKAYNPSGEINGPSEIVNFYCDSLKYQILSVKYGIQPSIQSYNIFYSPTPFLAIKLNKSEYLNQNSVLTRGYFDSSFLDYFEFGIFFILGLLHLLYFYNYRINRTNFYFGLFCLTSASYFIIQACIFEFVHLTEIRYYISFPYIFFYIFSMILLLLAVYSLFQHPIGYYLKLLIFLLLGAFIIKFFDSTLSVDALIVLLVLTNLEVARVAFIALKNKKNGGLIISIGGLIYAISFIIFILNEVIYLGILEHEIIKHTTYNVACLSIPICITIFLSIEFAKTTKSLAVKLSENEKLALQNQQILSAQNETLEKQVKERTTELYNSLTQLKATQSQLIQSEKLASLGELTAGIAHEIQNPLNFVNNFSELSVDLVKELKDEIKKPEIDRELIDDLTNDLSQNQEKINHHGKRASSIVKGMLEHSRTSKGQKEATDINALCDEYLRLAYHGLRAKDKTFNATMETHFDPNLPRIAVIPQDIGRVFLNLISNAFHAVNERSKKDPGKEQEVRYKPTVTVSTSVKDGNKLLIAVKDNGTGIPEAIKDKIFQPFFTTKPTGQGTGLGLSLSYDIVKAHGGELEVESAEGKGTTFIVMLPMGSFQTGSL